MPALFLFTENMEDIQAGDSFSFSVKAESYPSVNGWGATLRLRGKTSIDIEGSWDEVNKGYKFTASKSVSTTWTPGKYAYFISVENNIDRIKLEDGTVDILPDYSGEIKIKSWAVKTLEAVEATILNQATVNQLNYTVDGVSVGKMPMPDLIALAGKLKSQIRSEQTAENISNGLGAGNIIKVRI